MVCYHLTDKGHGMRKQAVAAMAALGLATAGYSAPAHAIGCISGGLAGAVAGHMVHHGVLGAVGGCIAGHHYGKQQKLNQQRSGSGDPGSAPPSQGTIDH